MTARTGKKKVRIGVFSGYDPRPWVMADCAAKDIRVLEGLIAALDRVGRYELVFPGKGRKGFDKLCHNTDLCESYASEFARAVSAETTSPIKLATVWLN